MILNRIMIDSVKRTMVNLPGWRTRRKILIFESDDWGMVRMTSKEAYTRLLKKGYPVDKSPYDQNDSLENEGDLNGLMETLNSVKDKYGNPAKFTLNMIMANPDFERIRSSEFNEYFYEKFTESLQRKRNGNKVLGLYHEGISKGLFQPQFHGREHVNVKRWLNSLQSGNQRLHDAFDEEMYTVLKYEGEGGRSAYLDTYGEYSDNVTDEIKNSISEGLDIFEKVWGFRSQSFIAPCYTWPSNLEDTLFESGVNLIQGTHVQRVPENISDLKIKKKYHYLGQKNHNQQRYLVRNVFFEPTEWSYQPVDQAMLQIKTAFGLFKPAIISSHRLNYIGSINPKNQYQNLKLLKELLNRVIAKYPDVEFLSSDELGKLIIEG